MRCQIEKNKEILCDEIEKLSDKKMSEAVAEKLSAYRGAYKALCMMDEIGGAEPTYYRTGSNRAHKTNQAKEPHEEHAGYRDLNEFVETPFTREIAMEWTGDMENGDGSKGPHWSMEQVKQVMDQRGIDCDPLQFFAVLNSVYSDYCTVAKKHGVNKMDFYVDLAKAWLDDPDAAGDKVAKYFAYIVKH